MNYQQLVSVVVPTYNQTSLLLKAINSILNQSHSYIEIIIVDDNYNREYSSYIEKMIDGLNLSKTQKLIYKKNKENLGSIYSRNKGIEIATGNFITFLDDDDRYEPEKISKQLIDIIQTNSNYSVCNIALTKDNENFSFRNRNYLNKPESLIVKHQKYHLTGTSTFMYKTDFLRNIGGFINSDLGDDYYLMENSIIKSDKFVHTDYVGVIALIDMTRGLSSWENKIDNENKLYRHKLNNLRDMSKKDIRYIKMRHCASKGIAYLSGRQYFKVMTMLVLSVYYDFPGFLNVILGKDF